MGFSAGCPEAVEGQSVAQTNRRHPLVFLVLSWNLEAKLKRPSLKEEKLERYADC